MITTSLPLLLLTLLVRGTLASSPTYAHQLLRREAYADEVCSPNITAPTHDDIVPPCIEVTTIEEACAPNGTAQIDYIAHAECLCGGSYFAEWAGCQDCLFFHGQRTERDEAFYKAVVSAASHSLCDFLSSSSAPSTSPAPAPAAPTTDFPAIFTSVEATMTHPTTGATVSSDQAPSSTAVSLYFTLSGSQGPGPITGSAATATATTTKGSSATGSASNGRSSSSAASKSSVSGTASGGGASSSSSTAGAQPTKAAGGLLLGLAGLAVAAGL